MIGCGLSLFAIAVMQAGGVLWDVTPIVGELFPWGAMPIGAEF